ncbi:hypothetical protein Taro_045570, partial [Colocasia esculenta]|nr:hypothetical protein [Colocasia esculenta]
GSKRLMKLSLGSPKKPPKHHSSGFLVDLQSRLESGKPSSRLQLASSCCRSPDELQSARSKHANFRRRGLGYPGGVMGCLIAVGDFSPMVGLACPRNFEVCNACSGAIAFDTTVLTSLNVSHVKYGITNKNWFDATSPQGGVKLDYAVFEVFHMVNFDDTELKLQLSSRWLH